MAHAGQASAEAVELAVAVDAKAMDLIVLQWDQCFDELFELLVYFNYHCVYTNK